MKENNRGSISSIWLSRLGTMYFVRQWYSRSCAGSKRVHVPKVAYPLLTSHDGECRLLSMSRRLYYVIVGRYPRDVFSSAIFSRYRSGLGCVQSQDPGGYRVRDPVLPSPQMEVIASAYLPTLSVSRLSHVRCLFLHWYVGKLERPVPCV